MNELVFSLRFVVLSLRAQLVSISIRSGSGISRVLLRSTSGIRAKRFFDNLSMAKKLTEAGELSTSVPSLKLSKTNYRVWSMAMEV